MFVTFLVLSNENGADTDEMPPYGAFHLGLHCLPKYLFNIYIQNGQNYCIVCQN